MTNPDVTSWLAIVATLLAAGCAPSGPVETLDDVDTDETSCFRATTCLERGAEAQQKGRIHEALPDLVEACERGLPDGCRLLGTGYALGSMGESDFERAASLYRWGCIEADDAESCHRLGELHRLELVEGDDGTATDYFSKACEGGHPAGCHDQAVTWIEGAEPDDERQQRAVDLFAQTCDQGLEAGCVNHAYMQAAGRGLARDHDEAAASFERACHDRSDDWRAYRLASLAPETERDVYAVNEYSPDVACQQLETLTVGRYEDRIIAAVDAESRMLRECYDEARPDDRRTVGRITIEAGVSHDSSGISPEIVDDELDLPGVRDCVERMLSRHLEDQGGAGAPYQTRWGISFVHPPLDPSAEGTGDGTETCDQEAIRTQVSEIFSDLRECGTRHMRRHPEDPGATVAYWTMAPTGTVDDISMVTTTRREGLESCLEDTISDIEIPAFDGPPCPVQVPFIFSDGRQLHFSVVGDP